MMESQAVKVDMASLDDMFRKMNMIFEVQCCPQPLTH